MFFIELPEPVPFADGAIFSFTMIDEHWPELQGFAMAQAQGMEAVGWPGHPFVSLRFWNVSVDPIAAERASMQVVDEVMRGVLPASVFAPQVQGQQANEGEVEEPGDSEETGPSEDPPTAYRTVVEAVAVVPPPRRWTDETLSSAFDQCVERIGDVVRAYRLFANDPLRRITFERLQPVVPYVLRTLAHPPDWSGLSLMLLHLNLEAPGDELDQEGMDQVNAFLGVTGRHPFAGFADRALDARVALERDGDYGEALIYTQISIEVLLDSVLGLLLWEEGIAPEEAANDAFTKAFTTRVKTQFAGRLGGNWSLTGEGPVAVWAREVQLVRGRVVHTGYQASRDEARRAVEGARMLEEFVRERVATRRNRYPRTALLLLGRPGLERRGLWGGSIRAFAERADEESDWLASYGEWRAAMTSARST